MPRADVGTGTTLTFGGFGETWVVDILSVAISESVRQKHEVTNLGSGKQREYIGGTVLDPYELVLGALLDPEQNALNNGILLFMMTEEARLITLAFPPVSPIGGGNNVVHILEGTGFIISNEWTVPVEERMDGEFGIAFDGGAEDGVPVEWKIQ